MPAAWRCSAQRRDLGSPLLGAPDPVAALKSGVLEALQTPDDADVGSAVGWGRRPPLLMSCNSAPMSRGLEGGMRAMRSPMSVLWAHH